MQLIVHGRRRNGCELLELRSHLDDLRPRQEDVLAYPFDRNAQAALWESVGTLLNHLNGKHQDECRVWPQAPLDDLVPGRALRFWRIRAASRKEAADRAELSEGQLVETSFARRTTKAAG